MVRKKHRKERYRISPLSDISVAVLPVIALRSLELLAASCDITERACEDTADKIALLNIPEPVKEAFLKAIDQLRVELNTTRIQQKGMLDIVEATVRVTKN